MSWLSKLNSLLEETEHYQEKKNRGRERKLETVGGGKTRCTCGVEPIVGLPNLDKNQTKTAGCTVKCEFQINND